MFGRSTELTVFGGGRGMGSGLRGPSISPACCLRITRVPVPVPCSPHRLAARPPAGEAFTLGPSQPGVGTCLHFPDTWRGTWWAGSVSAHGRQDLSVLQLSFLWWESEDQSRERVCPGSPSKSGQSWEWNPNDPQTTALAPVDRHERGE